jgi:hypothetical protein
MTRETGRLGKMGGPAACPGGVELATTPRLEHLSLDRLPSRLFGTGLKADPARGFEVPAALLDI